MTMMQFVTQGLQYIACCSDLVFFCSRAQGFEYLSYTMFLGCRQYRISGALLLQY